MGVWNKHKNDQFSYGGQLYNAKPPGMKATSNAKLNSSQTKLTAAFSSKLKSPGQKFMNAQEQEKAEMRAKVMKNLAGLDDIHKLSGCSKSFEEMLGSGDNPAGARLYLNFLKNKMDRDAKIEKSKSALDKIKELKQKRIEEKNKDQVNSLEKKEKKKSRNIS